MTTPFDELRSRRDAEVGSQVPVKRVVARVGLVSDTHIDLAAPDQVYVPTIDWEARFELTFGGFQPPTAEQDLLGSISELGKQTYDNLEALKGAILPLCYPCWAGEKSHMTRAELLNAIERATDISLPDRHKAVAILSQGASQPVAPAAEQSPISSL